TISLLPGSDPRIQTPRGPAGEFVLRLKDYLHQFSPRTDSVGGPRELRGFEGRRDADDEKYGPGSRAIPDSRELRRAGGDPHPDQHASLGHARALRRVAQVDSVQTHR